jgi:hypothetical protein
MTDSADLERRYRRLLAFYPRAFRREREQEILSVLMAGARAGQRWPRLAEGTDLVRHAIPMRLRLKIKHPSPWERSHPGHWILGRTLVGIWLVILTAVQCQTSLWGLALLAPAALQFYLAYRVAAAVKSERAADAPGSLPPGALGG